MAKIAFIDESKVLSKYYLQRNYSDLSEQIKKNCSFLTEYISFEDSLIGFEISKNKPLSDLFNRTFLVVRFSLANIKTEHQKIQEQKFTELMQRLYYIMEEQKGYYNLRIPSHIVDILKAYNTVFQGGYFCGGTVEEMIAGREVKCNFEKEVNIFFASRDYVQKYKRKLQEITFKSFKEYHGQYHISPITQDSAAEIYENWIFQSFEKCNQNIVVSEYQGTPIGFITIEESEEAIEGLLNAVDEEYRNMGAYRAMLSFVINAAYKKKKNFVISTQLDNFIVQGVWGSLGLKPFYSIYNIHFDKR